MQKAAQSEDPEFVWIVGRNESWEGPFSRDQILEKIQGGVLSWGDFVWRKGQVKRWMRICEIPAFQAVMPRAPSIDLLHEVTRSIEPKKGYSREPAGVPRRSIWYLQFEGSEFGPLNLQEVEVILKSGKLQGRLMAWRQGLDAWTPVGHLAELVRVMESVPLSEPYQAQRDERRKSPRVPLVATVRFALQANPAARKEIYTGVCRDISSTGMLVLCNHRPESFNRLIRLEVIPLNSSGVAPFTCEAEVVHVLPDGRGFSVRFKNLRNSEQLAIDRYLSRQNQGNAA